MSTFLQSLAGLYVSDVSSALLDALPLAVCICDSDGRILYYNRAAAKIWGDRPALANGKGFCICKGLFDFESGSGHDLTCTMKDLLGAGEPIHDQRLIVRRCDGTHVTCLASADTVRTSMGVAGTILLFSALVGGTDAEQDRAPVEDQARRWLLAMPTMIFATDAMGNVIFFNEAAIDFWGDPLDFGARKDSGTWMLCGPDGHPLAANEISILLASHDQQSSGIEILAKRFDGQLVPFMAFPAFLQDDSGASAGMITMLVDISERKAAEISLARHLDEQAALYRLIDEINHATTCPEIYKATLDAIAELFAGAKVGIFLFERTKTASVVAALGLSETSLEYLAKHLPWPKDEAVHQPFCISDPGELLGKPDLSTFLDGSSSSAFGLFPFPAEAAAEGAFCVLYTQPHNFTEREKELSRTVAQQLDYGLARVHTEEARERAEERQRILLRELDHRIKNLFAVASGLISLSVPSAETADELALLVRGRLDALARAHALTRTTYSDGVAEASEATLMHALIRTIVAPYESRESNRVALRGEDIAVSSEAVIALALLLHELATNSAKYGALNMPSGTLTVECSLTSDTYEMIWTESGGPPIKTKDRSAGFGSRLAIRTIERQLGGSISYDWRPEGLMVRLSIARDRLEAE
ncbi:PAS domain-containing sensor histidine kinase [Consotaella salsifontis]|uniref:Blue-light-activated histidine kinase n=1 Tax=Consotaella salsifontis TaxID=1365950 RepID=A0A1T4S9D9_9HYPH|nr:HWE histidine kinase domain-containing protein [Consotaella salsifontis]SKA24920.1 Two-component sensor histidine kinase, contains HisKA and HATPase domains [Consotaella salsifontis]